MRRVTPRAAAGLVILVCSLLMAPLLPACLELGPCSTRALQTDAGRLAVGAIALLVGGTLLVWALRLLALSLQANRLVRQLPRQAVPVELRSAATRIGVGPVHCIAADVPFAFCAGVIHPRIYISRGLLGGLRPVELDAILLHEFHHRRHRDPLRYAVAAAARDVCFYLPLVGWLAGHQRENAELRADRAAMERAGRHAVAGALWSLGTAVESPALASFAGAAELRVAQLLRDPLPRRRPARSLVLASVAGTLLSLVATTCVITLLSVG